MISKYDCCRILTKLISIALIEHSLIEKGTLNPFFKNFIVFYFYSVKAYVNLKFFQKPVELEWSKENGELPQGRAHDDSLGVLLIKDVQTSDSGTYVCTAPDGFTFLTQRALLHVSGLLGQSN